MEEHDNKANVHEVLKTVKQAAKVIGVPYRQLLDVVNANLIPSYRIGKSRRFVLVSEILSFMRSTQA